MGGATVAYSPIEAVKYGWEKFLVNWAPWVIAVLVYFAIIGVIAFLFTFVVSAIVGPAERTIDPVTGQVTVSGGVVAGLGVAFFIYLVLSIVLGFLAFAQFSRAALETVDRGRIDFAAFTKTTVLGTLLLASLLVAIFTSLGLIACLIGAIVVAFLLQFYPYPILDGSAQGAMGGVKASWNFVTKNLGNVLLYALVVLGIGIVVGIVAGIIGLIPILGWIVQAAVGVVLTPILAIAHAYTYRVLNEQGVAS